MQESILSTDILNAKQYYKSGNIGWGIVRKRTRIQEKKADSLAPQVSVDLESQFSPSFVSQICKQTRIEL